MASVTSRFELDNVAAAIARADGAVFEGLPNDVRDRYREMAESAYDSLGLEGPDSEGYWHEDCWSRDDVAERLSETREETLEALRALYRGAEGKLVRKALADAAEAVEGSRWTVS